jgi:general secretion pathway protein D
MRFIKSILLTSLLVVTLSAREQVNVNFSDVQIDDFIKLVSKITNKNILINNKVSGTVDFVSTTPVYDDELIGILVSVLDSKGFTLVQNGSIYEIVRATEAAQSNVAVMTQGKKLSGSMMVTQAIIVKSENVDVVAAKIRYLISKTAKLMTMKENNTILLTDYPKNIETIKRVIYDIDLNNQAIVKIIPIEHAEAKKLHTRLTEITKLIFNPQVSSQDVKLILDDNMNAIIVVGLPQNVKKIEELLVKMDVESHVNNGIEIFALKNSDAKTVATTLNDIIAKQTFIDPSMKPNVAASEEINAIIAIGDPMVLKGIKLIVDELDKEQYQVYVQARIIEINKKNAESLGIKYGFDGGAISNGGLYTLATNFGGSSIAVSQELLKNVVPTISGVNFAVGAAIDFLETNGASKAVSNPSILCLNNKESSIYVGKTISISSGQTAVAGSTTTSFKREDVGLTLKIKPRVSSNDKVTLDAEAILENVTDTGLDANNLPVRQPTTSKQEIKTQAILGHGESIIIGGLVKAYDTTSVSKIPLLGDIPWIGEYLFSSTTTETQEDNLIIMLTPYVIDKSEKLSKLQEDLGQLAKLQQEYNLEVFKKFTEKEVEEKPEEKNDFSITSPKSKR